MRRLHLAVIGFGKLGRACVRAIQQHEQLELAGIVRRDSTTSDTLPAPFVELRTVSHISELGKVDAALVCVPTEHVIGVAHDLLQHRIPVVECATLHGEDFQQHKAELDRIARLQKTPVVVGAGWEPGALSLLRGLFGLLVPKGHTETTYRPGLTLHHSTLAGSIPEVRQALTAEIPAASGGTQHYVYVELEQGADPEHVRQTIESDPLFLGEETFVFPVDSIDTLEEEGHGVLMERRGNAAHGEHRLFLLEARFSELALAAQVMVAAANALPGARHRAYGLFDLPLGALWGDLRQAAEKEWI